MTVSITVVQPLSTAQALLKLIRFSQSKDLLFFVVADFFAPEANRGTVGLFGGDKTECLLFEHTEIKVKSRVWFPPPLFSTLFTKISNTADRADILFVLNQSTWFFCSRLLRQALITERRG